MLRERGILTMDDKLVIKEAKSAGIELPKGLIGKDLLEAFEIEMDVKIEEASMHINNIIFLNSIRNKY
jgi:hypothetical protein